MLRSMLRDPSQLDKFQLFDTRDAARELIRTVDSLVAKQSESGLDVRVLMYFDEAHALSTNRFREAGAERSLYNALCTALEDITSPEVQVFSIMLSTNPSLSRFSPGHQDNQNDQQPSWTETIFDGVGSGGPIIRADQYSLAEIAKVEFMVKFGRPLSVKD